MGNLTAAVVIPKLELAEKEARRRFSVEYKRAVLKEAATYGPGEIGALLWRKRLW